jgi:hypothetical protein
MTDNPDNERSLSGERLRAAVDEILQRVDGLPTIDSRAAEQILGYDEHGLPG